MKLKRVLVGLLGVLLSLMLVIVLALGWLLFTTGGARWALEWVLEREPRLSLEIRGGALATGLELADLTWRDAGLSFTAETAELAWTPDCLLGGRLCIDALRLQSPRLEMAATEPAAEAPDSQPQEPARLELPLAIRLELVQLADAQFELPQVSGAVEQLQLSGGFEESTLKIDWARIQGLDLRLPEQEAEVAPVAAAAPPVDMPAAPIELPRVTLPFDLIVDGFLLEDADIVAAGRDWHIDSLAANLSWRDTQLELRHLQLAMPQLQAELEGDVRLQAGYPLNLALQARVETPELPELLQLKARLGDSVASLDFELATEGAVAATVTGRVQPLDPELPFALQARWQALGWPLQPPRQLMLQNGELSAEGTLDRYQLRLDTRLAGEQVPEGQWRLEAVGDLAALEIQNLRVDTLGGQLLGSGILGWEEGFRWQAQLKARGIEPGQFWPEYPGRLSGALSSSGAVVEDGWRMQLEIPGIEGQLRGYPLSLRGSVRHTLQGQWQLDALRLESGRNQLAVDGSLAANWDLQGRFDMPQLNSLLPELEGAAKGRFVVTGPLETPNVELSLSGDELTYLDNRIAGLELDADIGRLGETASTLRWQATGVVTGEQRLEEISGQLVGTRDEHTLTLDVDGPEYGAELRLAGSLAEDFDWQGRLLDATLALPPEQRWQLAEPVALAWQQQAGRLAVEAHCWRQQDARLCLTEPAEVGEAGELALALDEFQLQWLAPLLPPDIRWSGALTADARLSWGGEAAFALSVEAVSEAGQLRLIEEDEDDLVLGYRRLAADATFGPEGLEAELSLQSDELGSGQLVVRTQPGAEPRPLSGEVALSGLRLDLLKPFLPQFQTLAGTLSAEGRLEGTLQEPLFFGEVRLADAQLASPDLPLELVDLGLVAQVRGSEAELNGNFESGGEGTGTLSGSASWGGEPWQLALNIKGDELLITQAPVARLRVDPDLNIRIQPKRVFVGGRVVIPSGQITLKQLPEGAVAVSDDVVIVRRPGEERVEPEAETEAVTGPPPAPGWSVVMDVEIVLGDEVELSGRGLSGRLAGNLNLRQRAGGTPEAIGELRIEEGMYEAYGQELVIRQGQLIFSGPLDQPNLNVEAVRESGDVVAGIRVEGQPGEPEVALFSEPGLPQEDILSYIIRGRALSDRGGTASQEQLLTQAALSLGIFGGRGIANSLAKNLGIEDFEVGTGGEGDATQLELSGYLNPDLFVRYGIGVFSPVNTLTLRYRLNDDFFVEAVSGLENAIDVLYEFEF